MSPGRRTFLVRRHSSTKLWLMPTKRKSHGTLAPLLSLRWWGVSGRVNPPSCATSVRDPALDGERRHGGPSALEHLFVSASSVRDAVNSHDADGFVPILPVRPLILTPELRYLGACTGLILQARGGNMSSLRRRGLFWAQRAAQGWGLFRALFRPPRLTRLNDDLHDEGCSTVLLRSWNPTLILGPPGTCSPPVSGPRIRNPEVSWRLPCPVHSKRCRTEIAGRKPRLPPPWRTAHHQGPAKTYKDNVDPSAPRSDPRLSRLKQTNNPIRSFRLPGLKQCSSKHISAWPPRR